MKLARAYRLGLSVVLAWPATDALVAAWSGGRFNASEQYDAHALSLYGANLMAVAFHEPNRLTESAQSLEAQRPAWDAPRASSGSGSWDDFAAMATRLGAV